MEPKTLKDIEDYYGNVDGDKLRQEAIKWVKEDIELAAGELPFGVAKQIINIWIKRFNITKEDLK